MRTFRRTRRDGSLRTAADATRPTLADATRPTLAGQAPHDPVIEALDRRRDTIEQDLAAAAGGASMCAISRVAGSVPAAKHLEGRLAAVGELRRAVRRGGAVDDATIDLLVEWRAQLERARAGGMGPDWIAYRAGGVDELASTAPTG
ncbi:MAG: hypothetical protein KDB40_22525 [Acidimicrobiales bacterium]|nr:hypothetical protein [Acidimicrobiales bacterium]